MPQNNEHLEAVKAALPKLSEILKERTGVDATFTAEITNDTIRVTSQDLAETLSPLGKATFSSVWIIFLGGTLNSNNEIWFDPKLWYEHHVRGFNGVQFVWGALWFDLNKNEWVENLLQAHLK